MNSIMLNSPIDINLMTDYERYIDACVNGDINTIQSMIKRPAMFKFDFNSGFGHACYNGHMDIVLLLLKGFEGHRANNVNFGLTRACSGGHMDIVLLMIEKGAGDWYAAFHDACSYGHIDIVKLILILKKECGKLKHGLYDACSGGHTDIVLLLIEEDLKRSHSAQSASTKWCDEHVSFDLTDWNYGLYCACYGGHIDIVRLMLSHGADNLKLGFNAINDIDWNWSPDTLKDRHMVIVLLLISQGIDPKNSRVYEKYIKDTKLIIDKLNVNDCSDLVNEYLWS